MKKCKICGILFEPTHNAQKICNNEHFKTCKVCGKQFSIGRTVTSRECCSTKCTVELRKQTMSERFGVEYPLQNSELKKKAEETSLQRFGVKHAAQNEAIKQKTQQYFLEHYGVSTPFLMDDFQKKTTETCRKRYGVSYTSQIPGRTEKMQRTNMLRYGSVSPMGNKDIQSKFSEDMQSKYGVPYYCMADECRAAQKNVISRLNRSIADKLDQIGLKSSFEFTIDRYSYDLKIEDSNILIEVNPTDTHNCINTPWSNHSGRDKNYHKDKTHVAKMNGYRCINIWDWDDIDKIINMLVPKTILYARNCKLIEVDTKTAKLFENSYHLQNSVRGQQVCLGLAKDDQLVQLMTFGKPRYNNNYEWELLRLCTDNSFGVVGGANKLYSYFLRNYCPQSLVSYCDMSKFSGDIYATLGMKLIHYTEPNKVWSKGKACITNNLLLQRGYDQLFHTNYGKGTSNEQLMLEHGWLPVFDCGQAVYAYNK